MNTGFSEVFGDSEREREIQHDATFIDRITELEKALRRIRDFPVHSEPVGGAYAMQDIAEEALKGAK